MIATGRARGARAVEEGAQAHPSSPAHDREALGDEGPVEALERDHIGHRRQRHKVEAGEQVGLGAALGPEAGAAQAPVEAHQGHEGDAGGAERAEARQIVLPVRIDQRRHRGQLLGRLMVVEHHNVHAKLGRFREGFETRGAAIHRHQQGGALPGQRLDGLRIGPIALEDAVRNMDDEGNAAGLQIARHQRAGAGAVHVVIAEDGDGLALLDGVGQTVEGRLHVLHHMGVGHEGADGGVEISGDLLGRHAAPRQHPGQQIGMAVELGHGLRAALPFEIETIPPGAPGHGSLNIKKETAGRWHGPVLARAGQAAKPQRFAVATGGGSDFGAAAVSTTTSGESPLRLARSMAASWLFLEPAFARLAKSRGECRDPPPPRKTMSPSVVTTTSPERRVGSLRKGPRGPAPMGGGSTFSGLPLSSKARETSLFDRP